MAEANRIKVLYDQTVIPEMVKKFNYKNVNQVPKLVKITINSGLGEIKDNAKSIQLAQKELEQISPKKGEIVELQNRRQELMQSEKIIENFNYAYAALQSGRDITSSIRTAEHGIAKVNALTNDKYGYIYTSLDNALI